MATVKLSRVGGVSFNGITIDNTNDIYLLDVNRDATPKMRFTEFRVPKRHGSKRHNDAYDDKQAVVKIGVFADTMAERKAKIRNIVANWVNKEGRLIFADDPNLFYFAKIYDEIKEVESEIFTELIITFVTSPFLYEQFDDTRDLLIEDTQDLLINDADMLINQEIWQSVKTATTKQIVNEGTQDAMPIITISGTATKITFTFDNQAFSFNNLYNETIYIDSENKICYNNTITKKVSRLQGFRGEFPELKTGNNTLRITGTEMNVDIEVKYRNTYIV